MCYIRFILYIYDHLPTNNVDKLDSYRHLIANPNQVTDTMLKNSVIDGEELD